jgi:salicylate hydroxylase
VPVIVPQYEKLRRARTDIIQAEARKNGLRYDSKYANLHQRDREIADLGTLRKSLFDYDVERVAIAHLSEHQLSAN